MASSTRTTVIRKVWANNVEEEFNVIGSIISAHPFVGIDVEYPGTVISVCGNEWHFGKIPPEFYLKMKPNVDLLKPIQIGLAFSDENGNLPSVGTEECIWEFNFGGFDLNVDCHAETSTGLLTERGINFQRLAEDGINPLLFGELMRRRILPHKLTWVSFHGLVDFGYLLKCLTNQQLPDNLPLFLGAVQHFFRKRTYDVKALVRYSNFPLTGNASLRSTATDLGVVRDVGEEHQGGSDSLLTLRCFFALKEKMPGNDSLLQTFAGAFEY